MQDGKGAQAPDQRTDGARAGALRRGLIVNGATCSASAATLLALLAELGYGDQRVATAVNGDFVPERARAGLALAEGDRIEIVAPRQGG